MTDQQIENLTGKSIALPGHFDTPVTIEEIRKLGKVFEFRVRLRDGNLQEVVISQEEADALCSTTNISFGSKKVSANDLSLVIESARIRLAYTHDPQFAVSISGIRTLPHQIEAVYDKMLPQPYLRFLLADDPGAGKTIMAGLLIKELKLREAIERVLILCPAPLTIQWQDEMQRWFAENFEPIDSARDKQTLTNPWQKESLVVCSLDYAKQDDVRERIWQQHWDLVIIDEAHKCSARTKAGTGRNAYVEATKRYELASHLTSKAGHVLLLTATPHHGDEDKFAHFLRLLDPDLFPEPHRLGKQANDIRDSILKLGSDCPWALRRLKEDLKDVNGNRLFPDRHAVTVPFTLNSEEFALYKAVTAYINEFIPQQAGQRRNSAALARTVLQRRLASSASAIHESLKRRLKKQQDLLEELETLPPAQRAKRIAYLQGKLTDAEQDEDDLDENQRDVLVDEFTCTEELGQLKTEIAALKDLVAQAGRVRDAATDSKLRALKACLDRAQFSELKDGRGKLLIFTEHRDTLTYIKQHLMKWGYTCCEIHGGLNPHDRKKAQELFRTASQICLATEAAGEGINLQFCHLMINYDMPWNPTRLEQRLGRIHRIGQQNECYAYNFVATDSDAGDSIVEGRILHRLLEKLETMKKALDDRVFDVIGEILSLNDINLPEMLREAAVDPGRLSDYLDQIENIDPEKLKHYEKLTGIALAHGHVDLSGFQHRSLEIEEKRLMPRYVEQQFLSSAKCIGLRFEHRADGLWRIDHVPVDLRSERLKAVQRLGKPETEYKKIAFDKTVLEQITHSDAVLMGPGHPLYAAVEERLNEKLSEAIGGTALFVDSNATTPYRLFFFEMSIKGTDSKGTEVPLYGEVVTIREDGGGFEQIPSDVLLDISPFDEYRGDLPIIDHQPAADFLKANYQFERRTICQNERKHFAQIVREYLEKSFKARIDKAQVRWMELMAETGNNPNFALAADEARKYHDDLVRSRDERMAALNRLQIARTGPIKHLGTAIVVTNRENVNDQIEKMAIDPDAALRIRKEKRAEEIVVDALISEGFSKESIQLVGNQRIGFDIRAQRIIDHATGQADVRRIEVKGYSRGNDIQLTVNEWYKAEQLGPTYWLYVVWNPLEDDHDLLRINNPAKKLDYAKKEISASRLFTVPADAIIRASKRE